MHSFSERSLVTILLLIFVCALFYASLGLSPVSRVVPISVLIPTIALIALQLILDIAPSVVSRLRAIDQKDVFGVDHLRGDRRDNSVDPISRRNVELNVILWVLMLPLMIYLLGLIAALPLFAFLYLKVRSAEGWMLSMVTSGVLLAFVYSILRFTFPAALKLGYIWTWFGS